MIIDKVIYNLDNAYINFLVGEKENWVNPGKIVAFEYNAFNYYFSVKEVYNKRTDSSILVAVAYECTPYNDPDDPKKPKKPIYRTVDPRKLVGMELRGLRKGNETSVVNKWRDSGVLIPFE